MDIAFSYYLIKKLELNDKKMSRELKEKYYKEKNIYLKNCSKCGQPNYWCQCCKDNKLGK